MKIRTALPADAGPLLLMMRELARFEDYLQHFRVTEADLLERGLDPDGLRQFTALVAERDDGMLPAMPWSTRCRTPTTCGRT